MRVNSRKRDINGALAYLKINFNFRATRPIFANWDETGRVWWCVYCVKSLIHLRNLCFSEIVNMLLQKFENRYTMERN